MRKQLKIGDKVAVTAMGMYCEGYHGEIKRIESKTFLVEFDYGDAERSADLFTADQLKKLG